MRDGNRSTEETWTDYRGAVWRVIKSRRRLNFMYPLHAAIRAHVLHQAGYKCAHCGVPAAAVPKFYDGREALTTAKMKKGGYPIVLLVDHILTLKAGGLNVIKNFQCLCETCNKHKSREDRLAIADYREGAF